MGGFLSSLATGHDITVLDLTGDGPLAFNRPGEKRQVDMRESPEANLSGTVTLPAYSITLFRIPVELE